MTAPDPRTLRLYVLTSAAFAGRSHRDVAMAAIDGGANAVQLRAAELPDDDLFRLATDLAATCAEAGILFVVNDRPDVAVAAGAGGAHVGYRDDPDAARSELGPGRVLGISVASASEARDAEARGADYLGVTVWATATKPEARPGGLETLRGVVEATTIPVVGVGGIDATNARHVIDGGAAGVAVISAVAAAPDPVAATRELVRAVSEAFERRGGNRP